jgi:Domain of unknown function (DUF4202)
MTMSAPSERFLETVAEIDRLNGSDPRQEVADGATRPREVIYAERMSQCLALVYPQASEALRIAARAQHICRWQIARDRFPLGRDGYNAWRSACRDHHAGLTTEIMRARGYSDAEIAHVVKLIRKQDLKRDPESQALENVVGVVFVEHYLAEFVASHAEYDEEKLGGILRKTLRKMDPVGHDAIAKLTLPPTLERLVAISKEQV